ncbi:response regulator transcription factor [Achromobacter sp. Root565]|uniref:response regulator transcription factor n=1 Tax=Achromobacter sp. Root565 TaxID=1736564 RepID=UPI0006FECF46|nr:response regulator transcription factor [Achromobacter sp. Root565]KRA01262.1 LuxR family transcriptional regulator [Achromobacter sp. Root565]
MKIRILLADDHPAVLSGITHELSSVPSIVVEGVAQESGQLVELLRTTPCDVLVTDYAMPGGALGDGLTFISYLRRTFPDLKIVVFTMLDNSAVVQELSKIGVHSVLGKSHATRRLVSAIHAVYAGARYFPADDRTRPNDLHAMRSQVASDLTKRELEVVRLFVSGMSVNEIATQLNRSKQTISTQKTSAMRKLNVERDADLFRFAFETGIAVASEGSDRTPDSSSSDET